MIKYVELINSNNCTFERNKIYNFLTNQIKNEVKYTFIEVCN